MGNGNVASIGEVLALAGFFSLMLGFWLLTPNTGSLCSQPPGSNVPSCPTDYSPLVLPTVIGGALIVAGALVFLVFAPPSLATTALGGGASTGPPRSFCYP